MTYNEKIGEIITDLRNASPMHARQKLNYLIRDLGYEDNEAGCDSNE